MKYISDLIDKAGTPWNLAAKLNLHPNTFRHWQKIGVPKKYWDALFYHFGISPAELTLLTKSCKKRNGYKTNSINK